MDVVLINSFEDLPTSTIEVPINSKASTKAKIGFESVDNLVS